MFDEAESAAVVVALQGIREELAGIRKMWAESALFQINEKQLKAIQAMEGGVVGAMIVPGGAPPPGGPRRM